MKPQTYCQIIIHFYYIKLFLLNYLSILYHLIGNFILIYFFIISYSKKLLIYIWKIIYFKVLIDIDIELINK
jgi:hypothetical protein